MPDEADANLSLVLKVIGELTKRATLDTEFESYGSVTENTQERSAVWCKAQQESDIRWLSAIFTGMREMSKEQESNSSTKSIWPNKEEDEGSCFR